MSAIITLHEVIIAGVRINFQNEENAIPKSTKDGTKFGIKLFKPNTISL